ncbi:hypothetical protein SDC9_189474 [bioreactor metagenome]|uniref:Uncharacterized protein n=1 Tax=bioreactor metagenome TaxID=1076179 RepID=A0A645HUQ0_9ZZZZ
MARPRERDDVVYGQEVGLVLQLADELQLVLDLGLNFRRDAIGPTAASAFVSRLAQIACRSVARRNDFIGILVLQLVKAKAATRHHMQCLGQ